MIIRNPRTVALALLITTMPMTTLPLGFALAAGRGGGLGQGVGAAGTGSAGVGGGAPAGNVGGGSGRVGGGAPGANDPAGNGSAGTGDPTSNARGVGGYTPPPVPETTNTPTRGGFIGGSGIGGAAPGTPGDEPGSRSETKSGDAKSSDKPPLADPLKDIAEEAPQSPTGLARPGPDGVSTVIVAARPCSTAAHETDGTTTCIGIAPGRGRR
jgi:hypothetical protein